MEDEALHYLRSADMVASRGRDVARGAAGRRVNATLGRPAGGARLWKVVRDPPCLPARSPHPVPARFTLPRPSDPSPPPPPPCNCQVPGTVKDVVEGEGPNASVYLNRNMSLMERSTLALSLR